MELLFLLFLMLIMFLPLLVFLVNDDSNAFIKVDLPGVKDCDLPKTFLDIDKSREIRLKFHRASRKNGPSKQKR